MQDLSCYPSVVAPSDGGHPPPFHDVEFRDAEALGIFAMRNEPAFDTPRALQDDVQVAFSS